MIAAKPGKPDKSKKSDYLRGLMFFICTIVCICSFFTAPNGESLFHNFLGLFGIAPGIPMGGNSTLYIFMLIPLVTGIVCIRKVFRYWQDYGLRFREYNILARALPAVIAILVFFSTNAVHPSVIDRLYFFALSQQNGLRAVSVYFPHDWQFITFHASEGSRTYSYGFVLSNHSRDAHAFNVKVLYWDWNGLNETLITDMYGEAKVFTLFPRMSQTFSGEFTVPHESWDEGSNFRGMFSLVLVDSTGQYEPDILVRWPIM